LSWHSAAADDEFERELARLVSESVESRRQQQAVSKITGEHMAIPAHLMAASAISTATTMDGNAYCVSLASCLTTYTRGGPCAGGDDEGGGGGEGGPEEGVRFTLLKRRVKGVGIGKVCMHECTALARHALRSTYLRLSVIVRWRLVHYLSLGASDCQRAAWLQHR
jgi:hypothetical protein